MSVHLNKAGSAHAGSLVGGGHIKDSGSWSAPSAEAENSYLEKHGIGEYSKWFLGVDSEATEGTKGKYKFPFSSDFKTADYHGLRACESRAAQAGYSDIAARAKSLFDEAHKKLGKDKAKAFKGFRHTAEGWVIE